GYRCGHRVRLWKYARRLERFDDHHAAAAKRAGMGDLVRLSCTIAAARASPVPRSLRALASSSLQQLTPVPSLSHAPLRGQVSARYVICRRGAGGAHDNLDGLGPHRPRHERSRGSGTAYARVAGTGWLVFVELPIEEWTKN